jgi:outer membrane protein OmpA-like peptidoglycan-associated protein
MKLMFNKTLSLIVLALVFNLSLASGQTTFKLDAEIKKATEEFQEFKYSPAIRRLTKILQEDPQNLSAKEMLAYSYKMTNNYPEALKWYEQLCKQPNLKPEWALNYAEQLAVDQQYEKSENWYRKYLTLIPSDQRAKNFARAKQSAFEKNTGYWKIGYTNLNTLGSEYSPAYYNQGLIFSSNRQPGKYVKHIFEWDNTPFTNLFVVSNLASIRSMNPDSVTEQPTAKVKKDGKINDDDTAPTSNDTRTLGQYAAGTTYLNPTNLGGAAKLTKLLPGSINSKYHNSSAAVFPDGSIIFTRNNFIKGQTQKSTDGIIKLKLYTATGHELKTITEFPYNSNEYSTGHPTLNKEGNILIFASDMPGGFGGTDLYFSVRSGKGPWTRPVNLGKKINTEGNELFPYLDHSGKLYFASTGHAGLGGLDLFEVQLKEMKATAAPKNMGAPINSSTDDFGLIISEDGKGGYFSSNRKGTDDIYRFDRSSNMILLKGVVFDAITRIPLRNSRIVMRHLDGSDTLKTDSSGMYQRVLPKETEYELTAQKIGYVNRLSFVSSVGIEGDSTLTHDIYLSRNETAQQYVFDHCDSLKKIFKVRNIYYDLDRSAIRADARPALDELASLMKRYPEMRIITSSHTDSRATENYNRALSLRRGESARAYLVSKGISASRIAIEYYGKTRLVNRCYEGIPCSEENQQLNRRTEFDVILSEVNLTQLNCDDK